MKCTILGSGTSMGVPVLAVSIKKGLYQTRVIFETGVPPGFNRMGFPW